MHAPAAIAPMDVDAVWVALAEIPDPEIPTISIVDLGVVRSVDVSDDRVTVELLPTFVGCPALEVIRAAVEERLSGVRERVEVAFSFAEPWTTERITARGRLGLIAGGFAPPMAEGGPRGAASIVPLDVPVACPICGSRRTRLDNVFGPTLCRSIRYCLDCRQPFEGFKVV